MLPSEDGCIVTTSPRSGIADGELEITRSAPAAELLQMITTEKLRLHAIQANRCMNPVAGTASVFISGPSSVFDQDRCRFSRWGGLLAALTTTDDFENSFS